MKLYAKGKFAEYYRKGKDMEKKKIMFDCNVLDKRGRTRFVNL